MRKGWLLIAGSSFALSAAFLCAAQDAHVCECGAHPPAPPRDRDVEPYAGEPKDLSPYEKFAQPFFLNYTHPNIYAGAGRDIPAPKGLSEIRIGFMGPIEHSSDQVYGQRMLHGAQLAIDEWNAAGGYGGTPFKLMVHNDYDNWQAKAVYGGERPTDPTIWGSASNEAVKMIYDDEDWAIFGSISSEATHILLRVSLKAEIPIVNSASTDPTIPETYIPWYFEDLQDDRVQCLTIARRLFTELGMKRVGILRVNNRYGRMGVGKLRDASRRLGHPIVIEQKYMPGDTDFARQLRVIKDSRVDAVVLWADQPETAMILKQARAMGLKARFIGSYRTLGPDLLQQADEAAEGFEAVFPYDPSRSDPRWLAFNERFKARFHEPPEQFASLAYDAMNALLQSICKAGLNRARIHDALADIEQFDGVTGHMVFDPNQKNVAPMYLGTVHNGAITYRLAPMEKQSSQEGTGSDRAPYARIGDAPVTFNGPRPASSSSASTRIVLFGPHAFDVAQSPEIQSALNEASAPLQLLPVASDQQWGKASSQLVHALMDNPALAILALDRDSAHLAEQLALKTFVPVLALSGDKMLTSANIPWIFRMPPPATPVSALHLICNAMRDGASSPSQLRDLLASGREIAGLSFETTGEPRQH